MGASVEVRVSSPPNEKADPSSVWTDFKFRVSGFESGKLGRRDSQLGTGAEVVIIVGKWYHRFRGEPG